MNYAIVSGEIESDKLYYVVDASVIYNSATYTIGQYFRGITGVNTFSYTGAGINDVNEVLEFLGAGVEYEANSTAVSISEKLTEIWGFNIEFVLTEAEKIIPETTKILGFAVELIDYPFYSFAITELRL
ncbi:hypothetical protein [Mucilaginibacter panaciglaebae]|uniref:Uncharacterized protein n=1 Tax=Mucilaginibacter panaciglaebae TaxID=502331 RepID=A0ABP7WNM8_9SPHI